MFDKIKRTLFFRINKQWLRNFAIGLVVLAAIITIANEVYYWVGDDYDYGTYEDNEEVFSGDCNVAGLIVRGEIVTYVDDNSEYIQTASEDVDFIIGSAEEDKKIKAILVEVDSRGGYAVAAEEIVNAIDRADKPVVALIRESGLSAGYWSIVSADKIFASASSDVGSIGVTMSYLDYTNQNRQDGIQYIKLSSGKFKDTGDPDKPLSNEERELLMRDVGILHENFIKSVAKGRNLDIKVVRPLADGSSMLGEMALANGLIDNIGGFYEVENYIAEIIDEKVDICW